MKTDRSVYSVVLIAMLMFITACSADKRYVALSFFFDGVPKPGDQGSILRKGLKRAPQEKKQFYQHGPYSAKLCTGCHESGSNRLIMPKQELCLYCHTLPTNVKKIHGPLAAGGCTVCHDPHGTANRAFLLSDAEKFCLFCHSREDIMKRDIHKDNPASCTTCHDAHGGDNDFLLKSHNSGQPGQPA